MKIYAWGSWFIMFCCGLLLSDFKRILQQQYTGIGAILIIPVIVKQPWPIWWNTLNQMNGNWWYNHDKQKSQQGSEYFTGCTADISPGGEVSLLVTSVTNQKINYCRNVLWEEKSTTTAPKAKSVRISKCNSSVSIAFLQVSLSMHRKKIFLNLTQTCLESINHLYKWSPAAVIVIMNLLETISALLTSLWCELADPWKTLYVFPIHPGKELIDNGAKPVRWLVTWNFDASLCVRDGVMIWQHFPDYWLFMGEPTGIPLTDGEWCGT